MVTVEYIIRNANTKELIQKMPNEAEAVNLAGAINKEIQEELVEVVKVVTTIEITKL